MDKYVTGSVIKKLREGKRMTQEQLALKIHVSGNAVSKWETGQGFPDISLLEPLARALDISVIELLSGKDICNQNKSFDILKERFYVCPVCGNVITATGEAVISCCGITLPSVTVEEGDTEHKISAVVIEDEYYVTLDHPMSKDHYISFMAAVSDSGVLFEKLYPESGAEARFKISKVKKIYAYCNRHGMFALDLKK